jgi:hypothetical protein
MPQRVSVDAIRAEMLQHAADHAFACADAACQSNYVLIFPSTQCAPEPVVNTIIVVIAPCVVKPPGIMKNANSLL